MPEPTSATANPASPLLVREASPADADRLSRLRYAFRVERRPPIESLDEFVRRSSAWMRARLTEDSPWRAFVAERDGSLVANVWVQIVEKIPNPGPEPELHAYVSNFFVLPAERNAGTGTRLLNAVLDHCRTRLVDTVFLWPSERSRPLYRRFGFQQPADMLALDLPMPPE